VYGGWYVFLGEDFHHSLKRLALLRLSFAGLTGALSGAILSGLLILAFRSLRRRGARPFALAAGGAAGAVCLFAALAALPYREIFFPFHRYGSLALAGFVFVAELGILSWIVAAGIRQGAIAAQSHAPAGGVASIAGWTMTLLSFSLLLVLSHLPLAKGVSGRPIILLSIDTLRGDRLGCMGYGRPVTPHLDKLASEGALFEQALSAAPWTLPSHASIFTSLLPFDHGSTRETQPLRPSLSTLAERLRNAGFRTGAFTGGAYVASGFGFGQGFETYEDHDESKEGGPDPIARAALRWIRSMRSQPFFVFVHTYEVHFPYTHPEFARESAAAAGIAPLGIEDLAEIHSGKRILSAAQRRYESDLYDGDVATADRVMGGMLEALRDDGILDRAILVVLSDHGDDLWDHDERWSPGHGHSLYQELLHVPLIIRAPGLAASGKRIKTPVSLLDVLPTLLAMENMQGDPQDQGRSVAPFLAGDAEPPQLPTHAEATEYGPDRFERRQGSLKVILTPAGEERTERGPVPVRPIELFDLAADPREQTDLSRTPPPGAAELAEELWRRVEPILKKGSASDRGGQVPKQIQEQLHSLGYVH
jgi:arylsulfatase A-like enzyme